MTADTTPGGSRTAIIGMAGRFPGAGSVDALWSMLSAGTEAVRRFSADELRSAGVPEETAADPEYLPCAADLAGIENFDAQFFGITPAEARLIDPQHRIFLECVWAALEDANTPPTAYGGRVGVFGSASLSSYLLHHVLRSAEFRDQAFTYPVLLGNDKDFLATRVSYVLNLHGPSVSVQSACSSSLVAVDQACAALRSGRCDVAVAGGVSVFTPQTVGYRYQAGGTYARDGHCRPFDAAASGMVRGSGCAVVVLKRLDDALADRDHVHAVVAGTAVNNDGSNKAGYSAPSSAGQDEVIRACLDVSGVPPSSIGYVEAHGTGTYLGDPIEVAALRLAYQRGGDPPPECALGSIKANIGHLDAAAGVTGLIKAALVLRHQTIPPQINFHEPNPELRLDDSPFVVRRHLTRPARPISAAAVTSLGIGGTNAHCVLTKAPTPLARAAVPPGGEYTLLLSAPDEVRVRDVATDLLAHLEGDSATRLDDLAYTLARGRPALKHRVAVTASTMEQAIERLRDVREGRSREAARGVDTDPVGDLRDARRIRLPGLRLRPVRHWIELEHPADQPPRTAGQDPRHREDPEHPRDPVEIAAEVFRTRLGIDSIGPDDDYFALGGDSLHAFDLVDALNARLRTRLTLEQFSRLRTPRRVAEWHGGPFDDGAMVLVKPGRPDEERGPVFLIHPSGGSIGFAHALARHSGDESEMYGIRYPAALSDSLTTIPRMARHYVHLIRQVRPHGPYRIGGYSLGGTVALEAARLLTEGGERVEQVLLWDTPPPGPSDGGLSDQEFLDLFPALLRLTFGLPQPDERHAGARQRTVDEAIESVRPPDWTSATVRELHTMYRIWRACDRALATHRPEPYGGRVQLFTAQQPLPAGTLPAITDAGGGTPDDWRRHLTGELRVTAVPGHHFSMFDEARLPALAAEYDRALAAGAPVEHRPPPPAPGAGHRPVALLFPGQGTQYTGMGRELFARHPELVAEADQVLGYSIADVCAGDPRRPLKDTVYSQPAIYVVGALALRAHLEETGEPTAVVLGHSVGEYNALEAAGVFSFADGLRLVAERGAVTARIGGGGMIAVTGLSEDGILEILNGSGDGSGPAPVSASGSGSASGSVRVDLAVSNAPRNHTLAGPDADLKALTPVLLEHGARSVRRLNVSGPFHSRFMRPAAHEFRTVLGKPEYVFASPAVPVVANTTGRPHEPDGIRAELVAQIDHTVRWQRSVEWVIAHHDPEFREIGGRRVLMPMITQLRASLSGP